jgi:putative nucleotidyltransferase with HDIG domain
MKNPPLAFDWRDPNGEYLPVSLESIGTGALHDVDVFTRVGNQFFIIKPKNASFDMELVKKLRSTTPFLYIKHLDRERYFHHFEENLGKVFGDPKVDLRQKGALLTDWTVEIIDRLYKDPGHPQAMQQAQAASEYYVRYIGDHSHAFLELVDLRNHDEYTYAHSVGVAAYSIALGLQCGYKDQELANIGLAGLLHDIGKCMVDPKIINKKGPLNSAEWGVMKKHPEYGAEILRRHKNLDPIISLSAEAHHENPSGTGYPKGLLATQLDPKVGFIAIADAFSALTTARSYSQARDTVTALKLIKESVPKKFDNGVFKNFVLLFLDEKNQKKIA